MEVAKAVLYSFNKQSSKTTESRSKSNRPIIIRVLARLRNRLKNAILKRIKHIAMSRHCGEKMTKKFL